jgi:inosine-uridine nucleoside N-ribohydrolase
MYRQALTQGAAKAEVGVPDAAAIMYAIDPGTNTPLPALVKVIDDEGLARGQTVIGTTFNERMTILASDAEVSALADRVFSDPGFNLQAEIGVILMREPDNAQVVLEVDGKKMSRRLVQTLTR